jgi:GTP-binding protein
MQIHFRRTQFIRVAAEIDQCPPSDRPEVVLAGKSNVGKSSLINAIADNKKLARVSQTPGKTRTVNYFDVDNTIYFADLPGYGYAKAPKDTQQKFAALVDRYFTCGRPIALVLLLIDIRHTPSPEDVSMISYLNAQKIPYFIVFAKCDKFSRAQLAVRLSEMAVDLDIRDMGICFAVSAEKKLGLEDLRDAISAFLFP